MHHIFTKDTCGYCVRAKKLLTSKNLPFTEYIIGKDITREDVMERFPDLKSVPIILLDEQIIGGYDELVASFT